MAIRFSFLFFLFLFLLPACAMGPSSSREHVSLTPVSFSDLDGWKSDGPREALQAFSLSCVRLKKKSSWADVCDGAAKEPQTDEAARAFFETAFIPYRLEGDTGEEGLFTGYYAPELHGSLRRHGAYQTPLYAQPDDLISVDLGAFKPSLEGQKIKGRVRETSFVPYDKRALIVEGSLKKRAKPLVWVNDPVDAFFLEIQGSGRVRLDDGNVLNLGYANSNGQAYASVGRLLAQYDLLERPITMDLIRRWFATYPWRAEAVMNQNESYVFFRVLPNDDVLGAMNIALTPGRSLAVDSSYHTLGAPVWLETTDGKGAPFRRLMVAQDTCGAIKGVVRGDVFWGVGEEAAAQAGAMQNRGRAFVFLPKTMTPDDE
ncbi:MAG: murein transglycosylase A [Alphaproteobacteria bacterium]|nr:murein transglycosylase A [Alphaproteobacteria bacterium]